jgi:predicted small lipoprotein YifL
MIKTLLFVVSLSGLLSITGCKKGPLEEAGEKIDKAVENAADAVKDAVN